MPLFDTYLPADQYHISSQLILPYDLFMKNENGKIQLHRARLTTPDTDTFFNPGADHGCIELFIHRNDIASYNEQIPKTLAACLGDVGISMDKKSQFIYNALRMTAEQFYDKPGKVSYDIFESTIRTVLDYAVENRDIMTQLMNTITIRGTVANHNVNVGLYGMGLTLMLIDRTDIDYRNLVPALFYHDLGKKSVPPEILDKDSIFTPIDRNIMRRHPENGLIMLRKLTGISDTMRQVVVHHHERVNGSGYPDGQKGPSVTINSRIAAIADVFEGLTAQRPYKNRRSTFQALKVMTTNMAGALDTSLMPIFVGLFVNQKMA